MPLHSDFRPQASLHYYSNGSGRDSYVHKDNGGLEKGRMYTIGDKGGRYGMAMQGNALTDCNKAPTKYYANGTGRDGYATLQKEEGLDFHGHLRNHPPMEPAVDRITASVSSTPESRRAVSKQQQSANRLANTSIGHLIGQGDEHIPSNVRAASKEMHTSLAGSKSTFVTTSFNQVNNKWL